MAFTYNITRIYNQGSDGLSATSAITSNNSIEVSISVAASTTNQHIVFSVVQANMKACYLLSNEDVTLKFNSSGSPAPTISLTANVPYLWTIDGYAVNLFTVDLTGVYVTTGGSTTQLDLRFLTS